MTDYLQNVDDVHSEGPWQVDYALDDNGEHTDQVLSISDAHYKVVYFTDSGYFKPRDADVRLIKHAPDMLLMLRELEAILGAAGIGGALFDRLTSLITSITKREAL